MDYQRLNSQLRPRPPPYFSIRKGRLIIFTETKITKGESYEKVNRNFKRANITNPCG